MNTKKTQVATTVPETTTGEVEFEVAMGKPMALATRPSTNKMISLSRDKDTALLGTSTDVTGTIAVSYHTTIIDRLAGATAAEPVWRPEVNASMLGRILSDVNQRNYVSAAFMSLEIANLIPKLIKLNTVSADDKVVQTFRTMQAVSEQVSGGDNVALAITEILNAYLMRVGLTPMNNGGYSTLVQYASSPITVRDLAQNVLGAQVLNTVKELKTVDLSKGRYTPDVLGNEIALNLEGIGRVLTDSHELNSLFEDIVKGVRAHIDPTLAGLTGQVSSSWRNHDVVREAARNYVFVRAALTIPEGSSVTPSNQDYRLEQFAPSAWAALKVSSRYAFVNANDIKRTRGLIKVRCRFNIVRSAVLYDSAKPDAVGQVVHAYEDARLGSVATRVSMERGHIGSALKSAYGQVEKLGTDAAVRAMAKALRYHVDAEVRTRDTDYNGKAFYHFSVGDGAFVAANELAALCATRVYETPGQPSLDVKASSVYVVDTTEQQMPLFSGTIYGNQLYTRDFADVFLAIDEFEPAATLSSVPQGIPASAMGTSFIGLDLDQRLIKTTDKVNFNVEVNGVEIKGAVRANDLGLFATNDQVHIVKPLYNIDVFSCVAQIHQVMASLATDTAKNPEAWEPIRVHMVDLIASTVLAYSSRLSPAFVKSVSDAILQNSIKNLSQDKAKILSGRLESEAVKAMTNVMSMYAFQSMQGFSSAKSFLELVQQADIMTAIVRCANVEDMD